MIIYCSLRSVANLADYNIPLFIFLIFWFLLLFPMLLFLLFLIVQKIIVIFDFSPLVAKYEKTTSNHCQMSEDLHSNKKLQCMSLTIFMCGTWETHPFWFISVMSLERSRTKNMWTQISCLLRGKNTIDLLDLAECHLDRSTEAL